MLLTLNAKIMSWYFIAASCCRSVGPRRVAREPTLSRARAAGLSPSDVWGLCVPGQKHGCKRNESSSSMCPSCRTCNVRGYFWHSVPPRVPTMRYEPYAQLHDAAADARAIAQLPAALGGFRCQASPAAYWAGGADALPVLHQRLPAFAETCARLLGDGGREAQLHSRSAHPTPS